MHTRKTVRVEGQMCGNCGIIPDYYRFFNKNWCFLPKWLRFQIFWTFEFLMASESRNLSYFQRIWTRFSYLSEIPRCLLILYSQKSRQYTFPGGGFYALNQQAMLPFISHCIYRAFWPRSSGRIGRVCFCEIHRANCFETFWGGNWTRLPYISERWPRLSLQTLDGLTLSIKEWQVSVHATFYCCV